MSCGHYLVPMLAAAALWVQSRFSMRAQSFSVPLVETVARSTGRNTGSRTINISSVPYADEEMQSDDRTPRASFLSSRSCWVQHRS